MKLIVVASLLCLTPAGAATEKSFIEPPDAAHRRAFDALRAQTATFGRYDALILKHAEEHHLNPRLVKSMIAAESRFYYGAVSHVGARGLMQVMPETAEEMGVPRSKLKDPEWNLRAGTAYLELLCGRARVIYSLKGAGCRDAPLWVQKRVVAAYHAGPRMFHRDPDQWPIPTQAYVKEVFLFYGSSATAIAHPRLKVKPRRSQYLMAKFKYAPRDRK